MRVRAARPPDLSLTPLRHQPRARSRSFCKSFHPTGFSSASSARFAHADANSHAGQGRRGPGMAVERRNPPVSFQQLPQRGPAGVKRAKAASGARLPAPQQAPAASLPAKTSVPHHHTAPRAPQPCACLVGPALKVSSSTTHVSEQASKGNVCSGSQGMIQS